MTRRTPFHRAATRTALPLIAALVAMPALVSAPTRATAQSALQTQSLDQMESGQAGAAGVRSGSVIVAPIPIRNPTLGTGLALGGGYLFKIDEGSDPSTIGLGALKTDNGSEAYAAGASLNFAGGRWSIKAGVGYADLNYDLYIGDTPFSIEQTGALGRLGLAYQWDDRWSVGIGLALIESRLGPNSGALPADFAPDFGISSLTADLVLGYDTRDDTIYPTSGVNASVKLGLGGATDSFGLGFLDDVDRTFGRMLAQVGAYVPVGRQGVLATLFTACGVQDETPFYLSCSLGGSDRFRGYPSTRYIADTLVSVQMAYRGRIGESRLGYSVFAGAGRVADGVSQLGEAETLSAAGVGGRYRVSRKFPVDFAVDVASTHDGDITTYIYVGQRF